MSKVITIVGGSGYLGKRCIQTFLKSYRDIKIYAISRNIELNEAKKFDDRVEFIRGDALNPDSFAAYLKKSHGVIHTVGKLISLEPPTSDSSYNKINYETVMNIAKICEGSSEKERKNFVYISAERGLMFPLSLIFGGYIESKRKAEEKLLKEFPKLNTVILRPGLITDMKERPYLTPLSIAFDLTHLVEKKLVDNILPNAGQKLGLPASSIQLDTLCLYACAGTLGKLNQKIYSNDYMNDLNNIKNINFD